MEPRVDPPDSAPCPPSSRRRANWIAVVLVLATLASHMRSVRNDFVPNWDDVTYALNPHVMNGITLSSIEWAFSSTEQANWHPITWLSHMLDFQMFQARPAGHHLVNVVVHALNVALLFLMLLSTTGRAWRSAVTAGLFALHPFAVESVAWTSERKGLLCLCFTLLAIWAYAGYTRKPGVRRYLVVVLFYALALMSKPVAVTLPLLLLLLDYWPLRRMPQISHSPGDRPAFWPALRKLLVEKIWLFIMAAASAAITVYAQHRGGAVASLERLPLTFRIKNALYSYVLYIFKGVWPSRLAAFYPHSGDVGWWKAILALLGMTAVTIAVWRYRERRYLLVGWAWYVVALVPMIGLVQVGRQSIADRYTYFPFLGLFIAAVWLAAESPLRGKVSAASSGIILFAIFAGYAALTYVQIGFWRNSVTLFSHALDVTPDNSVAETNLGAGFDYAGRPDLAMPHLVAALRLTPDLPDPHYVIGTILQRQNRLQDALREYQLVLSLSSDPDLDAHTHNNLGALLLQMGRPAEALEQFNTAIKLNPYQQNSILGRGLIEYQSGQLDAALADFQRAAQVAPSRMAWLWLGRVLEDKRDLTSAVHAYQQALHIFPDLAEARNRLKELESRPIQ